MRTTVYTDPDDFDERDEWPGCAGSVDPELGELSILDSTNGVESTYARGEWASFETVVAEARPRPDARLMVSASNLPDRVNVQLTVDQAQALAELLMD